MIKINQQIIDIAIDILNEALEADREAICKLLDYKVECNDSLANHATIQVGMLNGKSQVGMLGIINGLFGVDEDGYGFICYEYDNNGVIRFKRTLPRE